MLESLEVAKSSRILIVKLSSIGDVIMATPIAKALRAAFPDSYIAWVVETKARDILQDNPYLDEIIVWDRPLIAAWNPRDLTVMGSSLRALGRELRTKNFDIAIDLQGLLRSALVARSSGARIRIGYDNAREGSTLFYTHQFAAHHHGRVRGPQMYLNLLRTMGVYSEDLDMRVTVEETNRADMRALIDGESSGAVAALCPATTWANKHWTEDGWATVADRLATERGLTPVFLGAPVDQPLIGRIMAGMNAEAINAAGRTTLKQAAALLELSRLVVSVDSGLLHMAVALDKPVIGVFGPSGWQDFVKKANFIPVAKDFPCIPCFRHPTCKEYDCMKAITPDDILSAGDRLADNTMIQTAEGKSS